jgi:hypothetical protein
MSKLQDQNNERDKKFIRTQISHYRRETEKLLPRIRELHQVKKLSPHENNFFESLKQTYKKNKRQIEDLKKQYKELMPAPKKSSNQPETIFPEMPTHNIPKNSIAKLSHQIPGALNEEEWLKISEEIEAMIGDSNPDQKAAVAGPNQNEDDDRSTASIQSLQTSIPAISPELDKLDCIAQNRHPSHVGIESSSNPNNCYINVLFQMLFQMCEFKNGIIFPPDHPFINPVLNEVKQILSRYQDLYQHGAYQVLTLQNKDLSAIKREIYNIKDPNDTRAEDPYTFFSTSSRDILEQSNGIAIATIFNNPHLEDRFIFTLNYSSNVRTSIQALIDSRDNRDKFDRNQIMSNFPVISQKYILLYLPRVDNKPPVIPDSRIQINELLFKLKGIIVFLPSESSEGHYVYVTYDNAGNLSFIYNNQIVIEHLLPYGSNEVSVNGIDKIIPDNLRLFTKLLENKESNESQNNLVPNYKEIIAQNGYIFLYEIDSIPVFDPFSSAAAAATKDSGSGLGLDPRFIPPAANKVGYRSNLSISSISSSIKDELERPDSASVSGSQQSRPATSVRSRAESSSSSSADSRPRAPPVSLASSVSESDDNSDDDEPVHESESRSGQSSIVSRSNQDDLSESTTSRTLSQVLNPDADADAASQRESEAILITIPLDADPGSDAGLNALADAARRRSRPPSVAGSIRLSRSPGGPRPGPVASSDSSVSSSVASVSSSVASGSGGPGAPGPGAPGAGSGGPGAPGAGSGAPGAGSGSGGPGPGAPGPGSGGPGPGPAALLITKPEFVFTIYIIGELFDIKQNEEIKEKTIKTNYENLKKKINNHTTNDKDTLNYIIDQTYIFYNTIPKTLLGKIKKYEDLKDNAKIALKIIYDLFVGEYKFLSFINSNIILKPSINNATRRQTASMLCDQISELISPIRANKTIPSQIPNLTKRNVTKRVVKAEKAKAIADRTKAVAEKAKEKQTKEQIEAAEKDIKELKMQQLLARIGELSQEITVLKAAAAAPPAAGVAPTPVTPAAIRNLTRKQEELIKLKKQLELEQQPDKKGGKNTRKTNNKIKQNKKNKKTRRSNK